MGFRCAATAVLLSCAADLGQAQAKAIPEVRIPELHATALSGREVDLPAQLQGKSGVFVVGFSQASRDQVTAWGKRLADEERGSDNVLYFEMPVLESVPKVLRGWVGKKIAAAVPDQARDHFLPILDHEKEWRAAAAYNRSADAYVLIVDSTGIVRSRVEGDASDTNFAEVKRQLQALR